MEIEDAVAQVQKGDRNAYTHIVLTLADPLRAFIASYCASPDRVDEIAQRTFMWAYNNLTKYEAGTAFFAWLKAIAKNVLLEELEARSRYSKNCRKYLEFMEAEHSKSLLTSQADTPVDEFDALQDCLDRLSDSHRELIKMKYQDRRPIDQIARKRDMSPPAVKMALLRAREALRKCVEQKTGRVTSVRRAPR